MFPYFRFMLQRAASRYSSFCSGTLHFCRRLRLTPSVASREGKGAESDQTEFVKQSSFAGSQSVYPSVSLFHYVLVRSGELGS
jgi:hypothetical protein